MNDKNFIEELRQKREEYGVTQTRLAVACGISREYYNRIEKGKQPLNDELREIIRMSNWYKNCSRTYRRRLGICMLCWKLFYLEFPYTLFHGFIPSAG